MKKTIFILPVILLFLVAAKSDRPAYRLYNAKGHSVDYDDLLKAAKKADIIFFGEEHTNPVCHWLELHLINPDYQL